MATRMIGAVDVETAPEEWLAVDWMGFINIVFRIQVSCDNTEITKPGSKSVVKQLAIMVSTFVILD